MGRAPCCDKANVKKGPWSPEEDIKLKEFIEKYGTGGNWIALPHKAGLRRCGKSCRLRWLNYLRPNIKHGEFSDDEDRIICSLFATIGSRWSIIAAQLPGRTDNDIKNYWNTKLKKKLLGIAPSHRKPHQHHHHHQLLIPQASPSPSSQLSSFTIPSPLATGLQPFPTLMSPTLLTQGPTPHQYSGSSLLMFGGDQQQSCSSSDGTQISYGGVEERVGFSETYLYGEESQMLFPVVGKRGDGLLEFGYEDIKQLLIGSNSASLYSDLDDQTANTEARVSCKAQERIMYQF